MRDHGGIFVPRTPYLSHWEQNKEWQTHVRTCGVRDPYVPLPGLVLHALADRLDHRSEILLHHCIGHAARVVCIKSSLEWLAVVAKLPSLGRTCDPGYFGTDREDGELQEVRAVHGGAANKCDAGWTWLSIRLA